MTAERTDIPRIQPGEHWDAYSHRLYDALADGEIANGYRRLGDALEHVGDHLEYLEVMDSTRPHEDLPL